MLVNIEEKRKHTRFDGLILPNIPLSEYEDDWKR